MADDKKHGAPVPVPSRTKEPEMVTELIADVRIRINLVRSNGERVPLEDCVPERIYRRLEDAVVKGFQHLDDPPEDPVPNDRLIDMKARELLGRSGGDGSSGS